MCGVCIWGGGRWVLLVPIPKKGYLMICGNWRGISLFEVMGMLFAKVI